MKILFVILFFLNFLNAKETSRPMEQMQGDCTKFKMDMANEFKIWKENESTISTESAVLLNKPLFLDLVPQAQVKFKVTPEKIFSKDSDRFAGAFKLQVSLKGTYRISAGSKVWFDVANVAKTSLVAAKSFEMQTQCNSIFKVVTFELDDNTPYLLQVNSSKDSKVKFLITKE